MVMLLVASVAADQEVVMKDVNNWVYLRGQYNNQGYSVLLQVNKGNVKNLKVAWTFVIGVNRGHEGSPVVVGNMMYVYTAFLNNVYVLDLDNN
jgi:glucose dehydrogenase